MGSRWDKIRKYGWTAEQDYIIMHDAAAGLTWRQIAQRAGRGSAAAVRIRYEHLTEAGVHLERGPCRVGDVDKIRRLRAAGMTWAQIAARVGMSLSATWARGNSKTTF